ncbi:MULTISPECIES: glutaredoxin domain-containing protein [unclassified Undibacterium]|uniref:glutaredoxin domain-containing protein n=1 Tax=unclassified Undibacterium TaxID=2630295 RepID=UPI002AC8D107|nr:MULTISPECIES: glutaredoxin domain-containing protein [unclassified Undibacterium]MEB0138300.1 glutaredoxin domain-containing protein [Undibacterium sp. CCC2.1]MEB0170786.1 glutaredoxin domain-containing protein [Undibacterium sp. CCC1.1]MEB0174675.1 glutaredoxin domain-containing protein [Undibacterium sp. CCC3.4]MEB0213872.1 glutaredoxin domain-containing protein [Undibacterium sp. 5I2]WPX42598.1 glutaredoxin domain-containing protein [Undibacterium sp. CCC3.4]
MPQICPKCQHLRQPEADCPDWQCPACGVAYSKAGDARAALVTTRRTARKDNSGSAWKWGLAGVLMLGLALPMYSLRHKQQQQSQQPASANGQPLVVLYGTTWCGYCAAARDFFKANGIAYTELDVENSTAGYEGHKKAGGGGVPIIQIGETIIKGYDEAGLRNVLAPWLRQS